MTLYDTTFSIVNNSGYTLTLDKSLRKNLDDAAIEAGLYRGTHSLVIRAVRADLCAADLPRTQT